MTKKFLIILFINLIYHGCITSPTKPIRLPKTGAYIGAGVGIGKSFSLDFKPKEKRTFSYFDSESLDSGGSSLEVGAGYVWTKNFYTGFSTLPHHVLFSYFDLYYFINHFEPFLMGVGLEASVFFPGIYTLFGIEFGHHEVGIGLRYNKSIFAIDAAPSKAERRARATKYPDYYNLFLQYWFPQDPVYIGFMFDYHYAPTGVLNFNDRRDDPELLNAKQSFGIRVSAKVYVDDLISF